MKIKNVERFREDLYTALKDTQLDIEHSAATWKNGVEFKETMTEYNHHDAEGNIISLAQPMQITGLKSKVYITVDEYGVDFYRSEEKCFTWNGSISFEYFKNRFSFIAELAIRTIQKVDA